MKNIINYASVLLTMAAITVSVALFLELYEHDERILSCNIAVHDLQNKLDASMESSGRLKIHVDAHVREAVRYKETVLSNRDRLDELTQSPIAKQVTHR